MESRNQIKLKPSSILSVPINSYEQNFTFIVNDEEYKTSRLLSDLLSPKISQQHLSDPTLNTFHIKTQYKGDFSQILKLQNFEDQTISDDELPFISEVLEILGNESIELSIKHDLNLDTIITQIQKHEKYSCFFSETFSEEIDYISTHFHELFEDDDIEDFSSLSLTTIERIISNEKLKLEDEDQLISVINDLYRKDKRKYSSLYTYVIFSNISTFEMGEFIDLFDVDSISGEIWRSISNRLLFDVKKDQNVLLNSNRYTRKGILFKCQDDERENSFSGIIRHLLNEASEGEIEKVIDISSSTYSGQHIPNLAVSFDDEEKFFQSQSEKDGWLCFEFLGHRVIPTDYKIRSYSGSPNYLKSWVLEGSDDKEKWEVIDSQQNCTLLEGKLLVHTFHISQEKQKVFRYIRIRITGSSCSYGYYYLTLNSFELYGNLL